MAIEVQPQATEALPSAEAHSAIADKPSMAKSAEKWASEAKKADDAKAADQAADLAAARGEAPAQADKPRGKNGQFLPEKGKKDAARRGSDKGAGDPAGKEPVAGAEPARADERGNDGGAPKDAPPELSGGLGKAKRLAREGKIAEALKLIDLDPERVPGGAWAAWRKENARKERELLAAHGEVERQRETLRGEARELVSQLRPFAEAKAAIDAGDEETAFQLVFGKSVDEWQRARLAKMHRGDLSKDPAVAALTKRLDAEAAERQKLQKQLEERDAAIAAERAKAEQARAQQAYRDGLKERLESSGDPRLERAAALPWFVKMVHDERLKHYRYDAETGTEDCISEEEAIDAVYDEERLTVAQWKQLTGGLDPHGNRDPGTLNQATTDRRAIDVKRAAKAPTSLSRSSAAEAAPIRKRDAKESLNYWVNEALASGKTG
jgi:hypothetical protein